MELAGEPASAEGAFADAQEHGGLLLFHAGVVEEIERFAFFAGKAAGSFVELGPFENRGWFETGIGGGGFGQGIERDGGLPGTVLFGQVGNDKAKLACGEAKVGSDIGGFD